MSDKQITDLLLQSLEAEIGGTQMYEAALLCAINPDLKKDWDSYLLETRRHVES